MGLSVGTTDGVIVGDNVGETVGERVGANDGVMVFKLTTKKWCRRHKYFSHDRYEL